MACYRLTMTHVLLNLTSKEGGQTPNRHEGTIVATPGILQYCLFFNEELQQLQKGATH